jgi:hypothetical protein
MLIRHNHPVPPPHTINLPCQPPPLTLQIQSQPFLFILFTLQLNVQSPPGINRSVCDTHIFHLFEIEKTFAVSESMK